MNKIGDIEMIGLVMVEQCKPLNKIGITYIGGGWIPRGYGGGDGCWATGRSETALAAVLAAVLTWLEPGGSAARTMTSFGVTSKRVD
jgi:hypothetical protein